MLHFPRAYAMPSAALAGLLAAAAPGTAQDRIAIRSATIIDVTTGRTLAGSTILIEDGRIVGIEPDGSVRLPETTRVIDAAGRWVVPGFVDVHTHSAAPAVHRRALGLGVTTIHMMPSAPAAADSLRRLEARSNLPDTPTPRLHITSPLFTGGFPGNVLRRAVNFTTPHDTAQVRVLLAALRDSGFTAIKVIQDDGLPWTRAGAVVPRLADDVFDALVRHAHLEGMRVYAHVAQLTDARQAMAAGADVFVHGVMDTIVPGSLWARMRERRTAWAPAMRIVAAGADRAAYAKRILADTVLRRSLSPVELEALTSDTARNGPAADEPFPGLAANGSDYMRRLEENTRQARALGITIAIGSDAGASGNGPGIGTHVEMELLQEAGLTPAEVLAAATLGSARAMGLSGEIGTIARGQRADLLILNRDPLADIRNARSIEWILKGGYPVRPDGLRGPDPIR